MIFLSFLQEKLFFSINTTHTHTPLEVLDTTFLQPLLEVWLCSNIVTNCLDFWVLRKNLVGSFLRGPGFGVSFVCLVIGLVGFKNFSVRVVNHNIGQRKLVSNGKTRLPGQLVFQTTSPPLQETLASLGHISLSFGISGSLIKPLINILWLGWFTN